MGLETFDKPLSLSSGAHEIANKYWKHCANTFITNPEYYDSCDSVLKSEILPELGMPYRALDLGCGNGRFTFVLATVAQQIDACDLSEALIAQARQSAENQAVTNVRFWVEDIITGQLQPSTYDLVSCMGVLSTIIDGWAFHRILQAMRSALRPGGRLLLRDSLSRLPEGQLIESETYATRYRNEDDYRREFEELGLVLEYERLLVEFGTSINRFFLYRVPGEPAPAL